MSPRAAHSTPELRRRLSGASNMTPAMKSVESIADWYAHRTPDVWKPRSPERVIYRAVALFGPAAATEIYAALAWMTRFSLNASVRDLAPYAFLAYLDLLGPEVIVETDGLWSAVPFRVAQAPTHICEYGDCANAVPITRNVCRDRRCGAHSIRVDLATETVEGVPFHPDKAVQERKWAWMHRGNPARSHWRRNERLTEAAARASRLRELQRQRDAAERFRRDELDRAVAEASGELARLIAEQMSDARRDSHQWTAALSLDATRDGHSEDGYSSFGASGLKVIPRHLVEWTDPTGDQALHLADLVLAGWDDEALQ